MNTKWFIGCFVPFCVMIIIPVVIISCFIMTIGQWYIHF